MGASATRPIERLGAYEILGPLGQGGMARAYVALRRGPGGVEQRVCLKRIRAEHDQDPEFVRQFMAEAKVAASVSHANLVKLLDFGADPEGHYLALELVPGMDLWALYSKLKARGEGIAPELVAYIAIELATALEVLHRANPEGFHAGLVHRDVSPSNVLISYDGEVKLADFGIARAVDGPKHTTTGVIKGKVPYMAPRYARTGVADVRGDLFAVGVVLFELLAGRRPHQGATDLITLELAAKGERPPLASLAPHAAPGLVAAAERLLEPDPERGYQSATELLQDLTALPLAGASLRRQLGQLVEQLRPLRASVFSARASQPDSQPPTSPPPAAHANTPTVPDRPPMMLAGPTDSTRRVDAADILGAHDATTRQQVRDATHTRTWLWIGAIATLIGAATLYITSANSSPAVVVANRPSHTSSGPTPPITADPTPPTAISPVVRGVSEPTTGASNDGATNAAARSATLTIVVVPFGDVVIDGHLRGRAPITAQLGAGGHEVTVVRQGVRSSRRVELSAGESKRLVLK